MCTERVKSTLLRGLIEESSEDLWNENGRTKAGNHFFYLSLNPYNERWSYDHHVEIRVEAIEALAFMERQILSSNSDIANFILASLKATWSST